MVAAHPSSTTEIWEWLKELPDPEIPVLSIVDLGIVRDVASTDDGEVIVTITPTYSGCPAMDVIKQEILAAAKQHGIGRVRLETKLSPPWTTDWISDEAKESLRAFGIAPPSTKLISIEAQAPSVACPQCGSTATQMVSRFGSTPCKALYKCLACLEPFDAFKSH